MVKKTPETIIITPETAARRLDVFLAEKLSISRSQAQKMIDEECVQVNGKLPRKAGDSLSAGAKITFSTPVITPTTTTPAEKKAASKAEPTLEIIAETPDYIVINKPTGLLTHVTLAKEKNSVASILSKKYPEIKKVGDDPKRPGIVHRLDKDASGLLVVARTQEMFEHLKNQFKKRTIEKEYSVLVHGKVAKDWDEINFPLSRSQNNDRMAAHPEIMRGKVNAVGKEAKTEFLLEKRFVNFGLLKVKIHTGRMHQIRAHMLAYNHPVVGDPLYFQKKRKRRWDDELGRLFLHATKLGFADLSGEQKTFECPLPKKLTDFLNTLA